VPRIWKIGNKKISTSSMACTSFGQKPENVFFCIISYVYLKIFTNFKHILFMGFSKHTQILLYGICSHILNKDKPPILHVIQKKNYFAIKIEKSAFFYFRGNWGGGGGMDACGFVRNFARFYFGEL
jgi:hypothetical protein